MFTRCPKCGHAPLPADQALPAACPGCGVILAKLVAPPSSAPTRGATPARPDREDDDDDERPSLGERLFAIPQPVDPVALGLRAALWVVFAFWGWQLVALDYRTGDMGTSFLHGPLLVFHEAGHVIFGLFGEWMGVFGGTLGQLAMPALLAGALLWKRRDPFGASFGLWLFGVSLLDVAPYVYDALEPRITLLNGSTGEEGGHDWIWLLGYANAIGRAHVYGALLHKLGAATLIVALAWGAVLLALQWRARQAAD